MFRAREIIPPRPPPSGIPKPLLIAALRTRDKHQNEDSRSDSADAARLQAAGNVPLAAPAHGLRSAHAIGADVPPVPPPPRQARSRCRRAPHIPPNSSILHAPVPPMHLLRRETAGRDPGTNVHAGSDRAV